MFNFFKKKPINYAEKIVESLINLPIEKIERVSIYGSDYGSDKMAYRLVRKDERIFRISLWSGDKSYRLVSRSSELGDNTDFGKVRKCYVKAFGKRIRLIDKIFEDERIEIEAQKIIDWNNQ